jgi:hypothetical protein
MREGVFNVPISSCWALDNPISIRERGYEVCFSISVWARSVRDIFVSPCLLSDRLNSQRYREFLETFLPRLLENVLRQETEVVVSARRCSRALWVICRAVVERDISRNVGWPSRADCMASSVTGSKGVHTRRELWKVNPRVSAAARQTFVCVWLMRPPGFSSSLGPSSSRHCLKFSWQARDKFRQVVACVVELERRGRWKRKNK